MRAYWSILLFASLLHPAGQVGWTVEYRVNRRMAPKWGWLTPCKIVKPQPHPFASVLPEAGA